MNHRIACGLVLTTGLALAALPAFAQAPSSDTVVASKPGAVGAARQVTLTGTIAKIDAKTRTVLIRGPQGGELEVVCGPEVKNFGQLKVGSQVDLQYLESLVLELKKGGGAPVTRTVQGATGSAKPGEQPGGAGVRQVTVTGDVIATDAAAQTVTVKGPERTIVLPVRDPEQFKLIAKGDQIQATYTQAVAVAVTPKK